MLLLIPQAPHHTAVPTPAQLHIRPVQRLATAALSDLLIAQVEHPYTREAVARQRTQEAEPVSQLIQVIQELLVQVIRELLVSAAGQHMVVQPAPLSGPASHLRVAKRM